MSVADTTVAAIVVLTAVAASALLCACGRDGHDDPVVDRIQAPTLVDRGSEPRVPLRHALVKGTRSFSLEQATETRSGEKWVSHTTHAALDVTIDDVTASGARLAIVMRDIRTEGEGAGGGAATTPAMALHYACRIDGRGAVSDATFELTGVEPGALHDARRDGLGSVVAEVVRSSMAPLPDGPIGVGATWTVDGSTTS